MVMSFSWRKSTQNLREPSFFFTSTILEDQGLIDGSIMPSDLILEISSLASFNFAKGILLGLCFIGLEFPVFISCLTKVVCPKSEESFENKC